MFPARFGHARPDVARALRRYPSALRSGFEIDIVVPRGHRQVTLEYEVSGRWRRLCRLDLIGTLPALDAELESPRRWAREGVASFKGWCCHPTRRIAHLAMMAGGYVTECEHGLSRPDVGAALPDHVEADASGFRALVPLATGYSAVKLIATLESGEELTHTLVHRLTVGPSLLTVRRHAEAVLAFAKDLRRRRTREHPRLVEVPSLVARAWKRWKTLVANGDRQAPSAGLDSRDPARSEPPTARREPTAR